MNLFKTTFVIAALLVTAAIATPATAAPQFQISQVDAQIKSATALYLHMEANSLASPEELETIRTLLNKLVGQRNQLRENDVALAELTAQYRKAVAQYNHYAKLLRDNAHRLPRAKVAELRRLLTEFRAEIDKAQAYLAQGLKERTENYELVLGNAQALIDTLRELIADRAPAT